MSLAIFILGGKAISNEFLRMIGVNETVFLAMIMCGGFLIVTASVGVSAAYSKNECLAFIVRMVFKFTLFSLDSLECPSCLSL